MTAITTCTRRRVTIRRRRGFIRALYLPHGYSDDASGWTAVGRAQVILDNLIAQGKAQPMLVVMTLGYGDPGMGDDADRERLPGSDGPEGARHRGAVDRLIKFNRNFVDFLKSKQVNATLRETGGAHTWLVWRISRRYYFKRNSQTSAGLVRL